MGCTMLCRFHFGCCKANIFLPGHAFLIFWMKGFLSLGKKLLEASGQNMHSTLRGYWGELIMEYDYGETEMRSHWDLYWRRICRAGRFQVFAGEDCRDHRGLRRTAQTESGHFVRTIWIYNSLAQSLSAINGETYLSFACPGVSLWKTACQYA